MGLDVCHEETNPYPYRKSKQASNVGVVRCHVSHLKGNILGGSSDSGSQIIPDFTPVSFSFLPYSGPS